MTQSVTAGDRILNTTPGVLSARRRGWSIAPATSITPAWCEATRKLIQENRLVVHVRPVINREVVVHRTNTIVKDIDLHKVNTTNKVREEVRNETVNRYAQGETRHVTERREVRGVNCNCPGNSNYQGERVSYRY